MERYTWRRAHPRIWVALVVWQRDSPLGALIPALSLPPKEVYH